jgi:hypothetical protein
MFAQLQAFLAAWTETAKAVSALAAYVQTQQMKQAGIDAQKVVTLEAENESLRTRLAAVTGVAGQSGAGKL